MAGDDDRRAWTTSTGPSPLDRRPRRASTSCTARGGAARDGAPRWCVQANRGSCDDEPRRDESSVHHLFDEPLDLCHGRAPGSCQHCSRVTATRLRSLPRRTIEHGRTWTTQVCCPLGSGFLSRGSAGSRSAPLDAPRRKDFDLTTGRRPSASSPSTARLCVKSSVQSEHRIHHNARRFISQPSVGQVLEAARSADVAKVVLVVTVFSYPKTRRCRFARSSSGGYP